MTWPWPGGPSSGGGGGSGRPAALTPTLFSPFAQWALLFDGTLVNGADRSGNARNLTNAFPYCLDDIIPSQLSAYAMQTSDVGWVSSALQGPAFVMAACTITARIRTPPTVLGGSTVILSIGGPSGGAGERVSLDFNVFRGDGLLRCFWQEATGASVDFVSTLPVNDGHWHFVSFRRTAGFVVTLGVDGAYQASGALAAPGTALTPLVSITFQNGGARRWLGQIADVCFWNSVLTDAQVNALNAVAMGTQYDRFQAP